MNVLKIESVSIEKEICSLLIAHEGPMSIARHESSGKHQFPDP